MFISEQSVGTLDAQQGRVGYVARLKLLPLTDVLNILDPDQLPVPGRPMTVNKGGLLVARDAALTELIMPPAQATFEETMQADSNGVVYPLLMKATAPTSPALLDWLYRGHFRRWMAIWIDLMGQPYIAGEPGRGLTLQYQRSLAQSNVVQFTLSGRSLHPAYYLETFQSVDLFPDADFDNSFDFSYF